MWHILFNILKQISNIKFYVVLKLQCFNQFLCVLCILVDFCFSLGSLVSVAYMSFISVRMQLFSCSLAVVQSRPRSSSFPSTVTRVVSGPAPKQLHTPQPVPRSRTSPLPKTSTPLQHHRYGEIYYGVHDSVRVLS